MLDCGGARDETDGCASDFKLNYFSDYVGNASGENFQESSNFFNCNFFDLFCVWYDNFL